MKKLSWLIWLVVTLGIFSFFGYELMFAKQKPNFLPGAVTHGHFQIEMACDTCHTDPFGGGEVLQDACVSCHGDELKQSLDSHPRKKFTDPRNAELLEIIDARYCASCHMEHQEAMISDMGVSLPTDYCYHCHVDVGKDRGSHKDLPYDSCQSAGCHNYHDNRALYEGFLAKHIGEPNHLEVISVKPDFYEQNLQKLAKMNGFTPEPLNEKDATAEAENGDLMASWAHSSHAEAGVNCDSCHGSGDDYVEIPQPEDCKSCHNFEVESFLKGKHGMRLAAGLSAMKPELSKLPMHQQLASDHGELGCDSCHAAHEFDTDFAKVDACLSCHNDEHSNNFKASAHGQLFIAGSDKAPTCATCHMPKVEVNDNGMKGHRVDHNQNNSLRPNEKMIRPACINCHGLQFSLDALADEELIKNNFKGMPGIHIESIEWVEKRNQKNSNSVY